MRSLTLAALAVALALPAVAADRWTVKATSPGAPIAPTRIVTGSDVEAWPLDYLPARVGAACDCSQRWAGPAELRPGMPEPLPGPTWCVVAGRRAIAAVCEAKP